MMAGLTRHDSFQIKCLQTVSIPAVVSTVRGVWLIVPVRGKLAARSYEVLKYALAVSVLLAGCSPQPSANVAVDSTNSQEMQDGSDERSRSQDRTAAGSRQQPAATNEMSSRQHVPVAGPVGSWQPVTREIWEVIYIGGAKVGYSHTTITPLTLKGQNLLRIASQQKLSTKRFGQKTELHASLESVETPSGTLVRFQTEQTAGSHVVTCVGKCEANQLSMVTTSLGKAQRSSMDWDPSWGGFFAYVFSPIKQPMTPGEKRTVRCLLPILNEVCHVQMQALDYQVTPLLEGSKKLLKIHVKFPLANGAIEEIRWVDGSGEAWKVETPSMQQVVYRTEKEAALRESDDFDLGESFLVKVSRHLRQPHKTYRIVYHARIKNGDPMDKFSTGPTQSIQQLDEQTVAITVRSIRPDRPAKLDSHDEPPGKDDLSPNNLIQSDDQRIVEMANRVAGSEADPWKVATKLEQHVRRTITNKTFTQAFATAAEVIQSREGDCTEHAVLLAALCRARKIPARVAIGLVYVSQTTANTFAYHMWNEVWIQDRWVPMDATLGQGGIGAAHLKLTHSNLKGASAYSAFLPVMQVIQRLELEIVEVQ